MKKYRRKRRKGGVKKSVSIQWRNRPAKRKKIFSEKKKERRKSMKKKMKIRRRRSVSWRSWRRENDAKEEMKMKKVTKWSDVTKNRQWKREERKRREWRESLMKSTEMCEMEKSMKWYQEEESEERVKLTWNLFRMKERNEEMKRKYERKRREKMVWLKKWCHERKLISMKKCEMKKEEMEKHAIISTWWRN
jgi:hypothetical protein